MDGSLDKGVYEELVTLVNDYNISWVSLRKTLMSCTGKRGWNYAEATKCPRERWPGRF